MQKKYKNDKGEITLLTIDKGSENYATPEIWKKEKLNGEKADIFSLGVVLFLLVNRKYGFDKSKKTDKYYGLIVEKKYDEYWKKLKLENLSDDFKKLYYRSFSIT